MDMSDIHGIFSARVRGIQGRNPEAHLALVNWGAWSRDRRGIFPVQIVPPRMWEEATSGLPDGYAAVKDAQEDDGLQAKAERSEEEPYNELQGAILDERINSPMICEEVSRALVIAYVHFSTPEYQYPVRAGCGQDAFCERLEAGLRFVGRFV